MGRLSTFLRHEQWVKDEGVLVAARQRERARKERQSMYGYSLGGMKSRGLLMAAVATALVLVAFVVTSGVAKSDPAPSTDLSLKATPDKLVLGSATGLKGRLVHKNGDSVAGTSA